MVAAPGSVQSIVAKQAFGEALFEGRCLADHQGYRGLLCRLRLDRRQDRGAVGGVTWRAAVARRLRMLSLAEAKTRMAEGGCEKGSANLPSPP